MTQNRSNVIKNKQDKEIINRDRLTRSWSFPSLFSDKKQVIFPCEPPLPCLQPGKEEFFAKYGPSPDVSDSGNEPDKNQDRLPNTLSFPSLLTDSERAIPWERVTLPFLLSGRDEFFAKYGPSPDESDSDNESNNLHLKKIW